MRPKNLPIILCASIALALAPANAQTSNDPSDSFLDAFSTYQKAEKLEGGGNVQAAAAAYKEAARKLEQISARWPQWNPAIVEYRKKRTSEAITKIHGKVGRGGGDTSLNADALTGAGAGGIPVENHVEPPLPPGDGILIPDSFPEPMPQAPSRSRIGSTGSPTDLLGEIQNQMNTLQSDLAKAREELDALRIEKEDLARQAAAAKGEQDKAEHQQKILKTRADNAEAALMKALSEGAKESEAVKKLQAEAANARKALKDLQIEREAAEEVRKQFSDRLSNANKRIANLTKERDDATKLSSSAESRIAEARKQMELAVKERELLNEKLNKVVGERDDALAQVAKMKESQKQVDRLINENTQLMAKLTDAEKQIAQFKADGLEKDKVITDLKKEVGTVKQQLADTQKQSQQYQVEMAELKTKLESTAHELAQTKTDSTAGVAERKKMQDENDLLRGIVLRQMKEQARRDQTRKLVLDQMSKLEGKSKDLLTKIDYLGQPVVKLSAKERALFKNAQIEISETEISIAATKPDTSADASQQPGTANSGAATPVESAPAIAAADAPSATPATAPAPEKPALELASTNKVETPASAPAANGSDDLPAKESAPAPGAMAAGLSNSPGNLPAELVPLIQEAKDHFENNRYRDAEKVYEKILAKVPDNIYSLSNLGVARFRSGKLKQAEESFKKAIAIAPDDAFAHCTLGIVYYSQGKYDEAVNELTKALAINPKNATAHNYLGITASQKGWQESALKELETATTIDPGYADAHFNLAVVYATQQPPNKENARRSYKRATELGAEPDTALEALLK